MTGLFEFGAGNETRTRDPNLGKVVLYQLSYSRLDVQSDCSGRRNSIEVLVRVKRYPICHSVRRAPA